MAQSKQLNNYFSNFKWAHPTWIDLPLFFKYIYSVPRGTQYHCCSEVIVFYKDEWVGIVCHNKNKHVNKLVDLLKFLKINHDFSKVSRSLHDRKFGKHGNKAQALEDLMSLPSVVKTTCENLKVVSDIVQENIVEAKDTFKRTCGNFDDTAMTIGSVVGQVGASCQDMTQQLSATCTVLNEASTKITDVSEVTINEFRHNTSKILNNVDNITTQFNDKFMKILNAVNEQMNVVTAFKNKVTSWVPQIIVGLVKVTCMGYLLSKPENQNIACCAAIVALALPSFVGGDSDLISSLIRVVKGVTGKFQAQAETDTNFIVSFFKLTKDMFAGLFTGVDNEKFLNMSLSNKKVKLVADYIKSATTVLDLFSKLMEKLIQLVGDKIFKFYGILPWFMKEDRVGTLIDRFIEVKEKRLDILSQTSKHAAQLVNQLYSDLIKTEASIVKSNDKNNAKVSVYLRVMIRSVENIVSKIPSHLLSGKDVRRSKPFWIYIYGEPRIGKSAMFQPYLINALAKRLKLREKYEDYTNYTYFRNCGEKYWEKYANHPVLWYNDLFQNFSDEEKVQEAILELTNVVDDSLYALNMAFEEKHGVYFNSEIVISNAQDDIVGKSFITNKCLSGGSHLNNRRNVVVEFALNEKYRAATGAGINYGEMNAEMTLNPTNMVGCKLFTKDMYRIIFHDPNSGNVLHEMDFLNGIKYICDEAERYHKSQDVFKTRLYDHFESLWAQSGDLCHLCGLEYEDLYDQHLQVCNRSKVFCLYCKGFIPKYEYKEHMSMCNVNTVLLEDQWFDASDSVEPSVLLHWFHDAVQQFAAASFDAPLVGFVEEACLNQDTQVMHAISHAMVMSQSNIEDTIARLTVIVEMAGVNSFENYTNQVNQRTRWDRFKKGLQDSWIKFKQFVTDFINNNPVLYNVTIGLTVYVLFLKTITWLFPSMTKLPNPTEGTEIIPYDQYFGLAQTSEGKQKQAKVVLRREKKNNVQGKAQSYDSQNEIVESKLKDHFCKFYVCVRDLENEKDVDVRCFGSGLCVGSDVFVLPAHFWKRWVQIREYYNSHNHNVLLHLLWDDKKDIIVPWDCIGVFEPQFKHSEDIVFLQFRKMIQLTHIKKFFLSENDTPNLFESYLYGMRYNDTTCTVMSVNHTELSTSVTYTHEARVEPLYKGVFDEQVIHVPLCYRYKGCNTTGGDCGMILLNTDNKMNARKILGMHTAGNTRTSLGIASIVFQEDIQEAFDYFYKSNVPIVILEDDIKTVDAVVTQSDEYKDLINCGLNVIGVKDIFKNEEFCVRKKFKITLPRKSKIQHSVVYDIMNDDFGPTTVDTAKLKPFEKDGVKISPLYQGLAKIARCSNLVPEYLVDKVKQHMLNTFQDWSNDYDIMFVLNDDQMINGYGMMKSLDLSTSPGFPYVVINNVSGKRPFFEKLDEDKYQMGPILKNFFEERETNARKGIVVPTYFMDTLKDETRPLEKVESGKTRVFQVAPMDFNLLIRKYFGTFISFCHSNFLDSEMAVGINANSLEWTYMIKYLLENSKKFINGDGKNFDASLGQQYMMHVCDVVNDFYGDSEENKNVRRVLFATFMNSRHLVGNLVYVAKQGNKSGIALTTIFNNLAGMFAIRLAYLSKFKELDTYNDNIRAKFYGDDDLITVKDNIGFDSLYYQRIWSYLGVEYTPADKGAVMLPLYSLEDVSFLQRGFVKDPLFNFYLPQLKFQTIMEIARWSESDPSNMSDQMNRFNASLLELSNYGQKQFLVVFNRYVEYIGLLKEMGYSIKVCDLFSYERCCLMLYPDYYCARFLKRLQCDLLPLPGKGVMQLLERGGSSE